MVDIHCIEIKKKCLFPLWCKTGAIINDSFYAKNKIESLMNERMQLAEQTSKIIMARICIIIDVINTCQRWKTFE